MTQSGAPHLRLKGNALLAPLGIINLAVEKPIKPHYTAQVDVLISPWKSFFGHPLQYYSVSAEGRYYFSENNDKWYLGINLSAATFNLRKWNYWNDGISTSEEGIEYKNVNLYQKGFALLFGISGGYQMKLNDRLSLDFFATIGSSQGFYKGYDQSTGLRYDKAQGYNKSGEILPYRGGIMLVYQIP